MNAKTTNSAQRLFELVSSVHAQDPNAQTSVAWGNVLQLDSNERLLIGLADVLRLVEKVKSLVDTSPTIKNKELYLRWYRPVSTSLSFPYLNSQVQTYRGLFTPQILTALELRTAHLMTNSKYQFPLLRRSMRRRASCSPTLIRRLKTRSYGCILWNCARLCVTVRRHIELTVLTDFGVH
jgi:hypothetical protein